MSKTIELIQQCETSKKGVNELELTIENCTLGNTLIVAYAVMNLDSGNTYTISDDFTALGGGNVATENPKLFFAYKNIENATEKFKVTQTGTNRLYIVCGEFSNISSVKMRNDLAKKGLNFTVSDVSKNNASDIMLYGVFSYYGYSDSLCECEPNDLCKLGGNDVEIFACLFDDGTGALTHTFYTSKHTGNYYAVVECLQLYVNSEKYLIFDNGKYYNIVDNALNELTDITELTAEVFKQYGNNDIPSGDLIKTLTAPSILYWQDSDGDLPALTASVTAIPTPQTLITDAIPITGDTITGVESITATYAGAPLFALSIDGGTTWQTYNGTAWVVLTEDNTGMSADTMAAITTEQWTAFFSGVTEFLLRFTLSAAEDSVTNVIVDYTN